MINYFYRKIKVWNLKAALNPRSKPNQLCIHTLQQHTGRVFRLQFDDFQIVSSSHDDTILIWDFARPATGSEERDDGFDDGINAALASQNNCLCSLRSAAVQCHVQSDNNINTGGGCSSNSHTNTTNNNNNNNTNDKNNLTLVSIDNKNSVTASNSTTTITNANINTITTSTISGNNNPNDNFSNSNNSIMNPSKSSFISSTNRKI